MRPIRQRLIVFDGSASYFWPSGSFPEFDRKVMILTNMQMLSDHPQTIFPKVNTFTLTDRSKPRDTVVSERERERERVKKVANPPSGLWRSDFGVEGLVREVGKGRRSQLNGSVNISTQMIWRSLFPWDRSGGDGIRSDTPHCSLYLKHFIKPQPSFFKTQAIKWKYFNKPTKSNLISIQMYT